MVGTPKRAREAVPEADVGEGDVHGGDGAPRPLVDGGRDADAQSSDAVGGQLADRVLDLVEHRLFARHVGRPDGTPDDDAFRVDDAGEQLRPAEIDADDVASAHGDVATIVGRRGFQRQAIPRLPRRTGERPDPPEGRQGEPAASRGRRGRLHRAGSEAPQTGRATLAEDRPDRRACALRARRRLGRARLPGVPERRQGSERAPRLAGRECARAPGRVAPLQPEHDPRAGHGRGPGPARGRFAPTRFCVVRTDPDAHRMALLSIPRDLRVEIPGQGLEKINAAYAFGGPTLAVRTVRSVTGLPLNHVVVVNFAEFRGRHRRPRRHHGQRREAHPLEQVRLSLRHQGPLRPVEGMALPQGRRRR